MNPPAQRPDVFYLGFQKDTGELIDVVAPEGRALWLDPRKVKELSLGQLSESEQQEVKNKLKKYHMKAADGVTTTRELAFIDEPDSSVCCGSCGGIPFCWC